MRTTRTCQKSAIALAVSSILAGASGVARAEGAGNSLEEIVVTATRRDQSVLEIPFNISAVSGDALENANIIDSVEALRTMAGVSMFDRGYRNAGVTNGIIIRGINVDSGTNGDVPLAAPPTVATYVDNTALFGNFILKDIDHIEVLRGPQGTLYGSGSLAGNVRYMMNKPDPAKFSGRASVNVGQTDGSGGYNFNPDLMVNVPLGDTFALRLNLGQVKNDGIVDYPNVYKLDANGDPVVTDGDVVGAEPVYKKVKDADDVDIKYGRVSAYFKPNETFNAQLTYQRQEDDVGARRQVTVGDNLVSGGKYKDYEFGGVQLEPSSREVELSSLELEVALGFATLTSSTSYYDHTGHGISDNSGVYARNRWFVYYGSSPRPIAQAERFYDDSAFSEELRLVSKGGQFVDWTAGVYYTDQDYNLGQNSYLVGYIPYLNAYPDPTCPPGSSGWYCLAPYTTNQDFLFRRDQTYQETAVFGEMTFNFSDDLHLTLGGRYFDNELGVKAQVGVPIWGYPPGTANEKINDDKFLLKANIAWDVTDRTMLYGTYSQGYRHAGANAVPTSGRFAENAAYLAFDADSVDNYEIGYKGTFGRQQFAVSAYYIDWQDPQLNTATPNWGFFAVINGESARSTGIELEWSGSITDSLSYTFGYTYADSELTDDVYAPAGNFGGNGVTYPDRIGAEGDRLPGTAKHVLSASLMHDVTLSNGLNVSTVLNGYYQSDVTNSLGDDKCLTSYNAINNCRDSANPASAFYAADSVFSRSYAEIGGFQLWNLSSTISMDAWWASLYVKNLFNEAGTTGVVPYLVAGSNPSDTERYFGNNSREYIALPRTFGLVVGYKF